MPEDNSSKLFVTAIDRLKASGGRMTKKREVLLGALLTFDRPASAEEIRERAELVQSDLVTVYRNLETFENIGMLQRVLLENGTQLFELTAPDEHYHHLICRECIHGKSDGDNAHRGLLIQIAVCHFLGAHVEAYLYFQRFRDSCKL